MASDSTYDLQKPSFLDAEGASSLKYLGFLPLALTSLSLYLLTLYEAAKDQAGPLKAGVDDVEAMLKEVVRPVIKVAGRYVAKLLLFIDKKVDEKLKLIEEGMPTFVKKVIIMAFLTGAKNEACSDCGDEVQAARGRCTPFSTLPVLAKALLSHFLHSVDIFNNVANFLMEWCNFFFEHMPVVSIMNRAKKAARVPCEPKSSCASNQNGVYPSG